MSSQELLIVFANIDTIVLNSKTMQPEWTSLMPGADNNASGVSVLLGILENLASVDLPKTVWLVWTDADSIAFSGTYAFLEKYETELKKFKTVSAVALTMLGHDTSLEDKEKRTGNMSVYTRPESEDGYEKDKNLALKMLQKNWDERVQFKIKSTGFMFSGNVLFWEKFYPAIVFTQNWESDFNTKNATSNDFVETLNFNTLYGSYRSIAGSVLAWSFDI